MAFELDPNYKPVPERIADLKAKYPDACLRPLDPAKPYAIETVGNKTFVVYAAACYRNPDDPLPGVGVAWEPFPGPTPYTRDSELQNAETSAWGRAIVATLASESKFIISAEDVRNRRAGEEQPKVDWFEANGWEGGRDQHDLARKAVLDAVADLPDEMKNEFKGLFDISKGWTYGQWAGADEWLNQPA